MNAVVRGTLALAIVVVLGQPALATVEMQVQAKKLGFAVGNCLYCHAHAHAAEVMKQKAKALNISEGNCLACHGANIPAKLNERGQWLVAERARRGARGFDVKWLHDYKEPAAPAIARHAKR